MLRLNRVNPATPSIHDCFYIQTERHLTEQEHARLVWLISAPGHITTPFETASDGNFVEIGPRLAVETPFSSNAVGICRSIGLPVSRIEMSRRHFYGDGLHGINFDAEREGILATQFDQMTQEVYERPLDSFFADIDPELVVEVPIARLAEVNKAMGLGMDAWDIAYYTKLFNDLGRNPTNVELMQLGNANSEHSRHWYFRGEQVIGGVAMPHSLMDIVRRPLLAKGENSVSLVSFRDNAGVIRGSRSLQFMPRTPGEVSMFIRASMQVDITSTAETHNHPTYVSPFAGAETGSGGRIRDSRAVGRGGTVHAGFAGYAVGNLLNDLGIAGEMPYITDAPNASPIEILIEGSNGVSDYGNKIGEPLIGGFTRSFGMLVNGAWREFRKPVLYSAGLGRVFREHVQKGHAEQGMIVVRIGGPAFRIGVGGGSASSMIQGSQAAELDFKSVQRGNAEMEQRVVRVIQACCEMRKKNPIHAIHDQGAGGPSNVLTELLEPLGGELDIRQITVGDPSMSVLELWVAEFQEGFGLLLRPKSLQKFRAICARENVACEVLGIVDGSGKVVVRDSRDGSTPVNLPLEAIIGKLPQKRFESDRVRVISEPLSVPKDKSVLDLLRMVFSLVGVGSKGFLVRKADRSVTGLVARQQCVGPMQVPLANAAVTADGYFGFTGAAAAFGEQPIKMLLSPESGARMAVCEMLTNMASVRVSSLSEIMCRANWMYAAKRPGEGAHLYDAAFSMADFMTALGIAIDGGKDSLSMAAICGEHIVVAPGQLVIKGYARVPDIRKVVTPDLKGDGVLGYINLGSRAGKRRRLGGSALAQALGQLGNESPDCDDPAYLIKAFNAIQRCIDRGLISAYHDVSDGGFITAVAEMSIAGRCGVRVHLPKSCDVVSELFHEEPGMIIEYDPTQSEAVRKVFYRAGIRMRKIGHSSKASSMFEVCRDSKEVLSLRVCALHGFWEDTSTSLEKLQMNPTLAGEELVSIRFDGPPASYNIPFTTKVKSPVVKKGRPIVAIVREEGSNGDREMAAAFNLARCDTMDVSMRDIIEGRVTSLSAFQGVVFPGGFSFADVFGSAKGWAGPIRFNERVKDVFGAFYDRRDTFSLGVCNGCQLMANAGWLPRRFLSEESQPRFIHNDSGRFESRWSIVEIVKSPSVMLHGMEGARLGIWVAHGEGKMLFPDQSVMEYVRENSLAPIRYVDSRAEATVNYPYNPNGSPNGWTALTSPDGRHLAMMPHPERAVIPWQWPYWPKGERPMNASPWLRFFRNARTFCDQS